ncbi:MAG TPA: endo-1,4-beta-xylanase [Blastocatellia bacterium]|nr:endo-1,4-beta-xylanase [Blastocatellia bacterium]
MMAPQTLTKRFHALLAGAWLIMFSAVDSPAQTQPLRVSADQRGFYIGAAVAIPPFRNEAIYVDTLRREFNIIVAENAFKWDALRPSQTTFNFVDADALVEFAEANNMKIRGHALLWHQALPGWLSGGNFSRDEVIALLRDHIHTVAGRYRGRIWAWDVVNEAVEDGTGGFRTASFWHQAIGPDYIRLAFQFAREADPEARLYYNDYSIEGLNNKSNGVFNLVSELKSQGVPIDGVGWQMHLVNGFRIEPAHQQNARRLADLGLEISMTEMDVRIPLPTSSQELQQQADAYRDATGFCLSESNCKALLTWGFTDRHSWIPGFFAGWGDGLIFDQSYQPKPAYHAIREVLEQGVDLSPVITGASTKGKKLLISGERFLEGADLFLNGVIQKKVSLDAENPSIRLVAKKSGKKVRSGDRLQVRNPDGLFSNEFILP